MQLSPLEKISIRATRWVGSIQSLIVHTVLFVSAFVIVLLGVPLDRVLLVLTTIVSLEAIYLSIFIQMSVNRSERRLRNVSKEVREISVDLEEISEDVEEIQKDVDEIQTDIDEIQTDVDEIQEDVQGIEADIDEIQADVDEIQEDVEGIEKDIDEIQEDVEEIEQESDEQKQEQSLADIQKTLEHLIEQIHKIQK